MSFNDWAKWCFHVFLLACVLFVGGCSIAGSEPVVHPCNHLDMKRGPGLTSSSRGWSIQSGREWVRIYIPGQPQLWRQDDDVPDLPENTFREWKRVTAPGDETQDNDEQGHHAPEHRQTWTIQDWQHQGYQRVLARYESFSTHNAPDQQREGVRNPDFSIQVEELGSQHQDRDVMDMFTYAPPMTDAAHPSSQHPPPAFYGGILPAQLGDPSSPSSERHRAERAISRSPRRCGYFGRH